MLASQVRLVMNYSRCPVQHVGKGFPSLPSFLTNFSIAKGNAKATHHSNAFYTPAVGHRLGYPNG